jgi:aldose 1-epimerase
VTSSGITYAEAGFGVTASGESVSKWTIDDGELAVGVLSLGGIIHSLHAPDSGGQRDDVVLGFDQVAGYEASRGFVGALIGRLANRVAGGRFSLDGVRYELATNEGDTTLHGGPGGFHRRIWSVEPHADADGAGLRLGLVSPDGDQGFPGRLEVTVDYLLVPGQRRLKIHYQARTDRATVVNLTQHAYFNLSAAPAKGLDGHLLQVRADHYTPVDGRGLPSGEIAHVIGTSFDLNQPQSLDFLNLDHNLVLGDPLAPGAPLRWAAALEQPASGRRLEVLSTEPGIQIYTGGGLDGTELGKGEVPYRRGAGVCLETQHFPDSPNQPAFPSTTLRPGEEFSSRTEWRFSTP